MREVEIVVSQHHGLEGLGTLWRELEAQVPQLSFFRSWSWVGCLAEERFPDPVVLQAHRGGVLVGLALFNRRRGRLCLGESGDGLLDAPFVEHNGPLTLGTAGLDGALLRAAAAMRGTRRLVLSGIPAALLAETPGIALRVQERLAPYVRLDEVRAAGGDPLALLSANARYQIRRSARHYGRPVLRRAETEAEALAMLEELIARHQRSWQARGKPGAFADPFQRRFHAALLRRAMPRDEIDLLRVEGDRGCVGLLYNFRLRGRISAYQSGLDIEGAGPHGKPGLTCHAMAIARAVAASETVYDFLGGADRYKLTLAQHAEPLFWAETVRRHSLLGLALRLRNLAHRHAPAQSSRGSSPSGEGPGPD
ncbi:GNAT family N-acetyltransferase [Roseococcus sp. SYP-B2431]|uniref:GNAT family N-acetyltransferase n=1 Tax=Roseococcus sp. SYP-B2431 TaxID=2496640 RepID=UPI0013F3BC57|nr:GNAT family N-acetyltransferase [Roseococcus sp. SYP-B2431]